MPNDLQQTATPERTPTNRVWMDLCLKHYQAGRNGDDACRQALGVIMAALEAEQPMADQQPTPALGDLIDRPPPRPDGATQGAMVVNGKRIDLVWRPEIKKWEVIGNG